MLVTPLEEKCCHDCVAKIAKMAHRIGTTLHEETTNDGIPAEDFDTIVCPEKMIGPEWEARGLGREYTAKRDAPAAGCAIVSR